THPHANKLPLKDSFTYEDYRWAVSSVMTRQNQIPTEDGSRVTLALIPLWDMCNHTNGLITTGYNLEDDRCECVALQDFQAGDQIYIFYGTRSNAEFVIHSGFFFDNNSHDRVKIKLGVSKSDRLYAMKAEVLARAGIPTSSVFALHFTEPPISAQLLAFLRITTGYNLEDDRCECVALQDFQAGDQIYIFYGTRSNAEFVIHSGFFFDNNSHDRVKIKLGVSKSDRLYAMKAEVLARAGIPTSSVFALHFTEPPISAQLLAFLRVFCMTEEELKEHLLGDSAIDRIFTLGNSEFPVSWDNEVKLWTFLEDRASLLLKTYKTTIEEDKIVLKNPDLSVRATMAIKLRLGEKEILEKAVKSAAMNREYYRKHMEERAPLPRYEESDLGLLEGGVGDSRLPLVLRKLEEEAGVQESLSLTETVSKAKAAENGLINGENVIPNGTKESSGDTGEAKERL
ncbi:hypothetical protein A6R68_02719, partial [Neotoma lepida]